MPEALSGYVIGDGFLTIQACECLVGSGHDLRGVLSANPEVVDWAQAHGVPPFDAGDFAPLFDGAEFDYLFSIVNMRILPEEVVTLPRRGTINFHDGPLPRYAGVHATSWALIHREPSHGVTWHLIDSVVDGGDILKQRIFDIAPDETAFTLNAKCLEAGIESFPELVNELADGTAQRRSQDMAQRSYFGMFLRPEAAGLISWQRPAVEIEALVRALDFGPVTNPLGRAKLDVGDDFYICSKAQAVEAPVGARPGEIVDIASDLIRIAAGEGALEIHELLRLDGRPVSSAEFIERHQLRQGANLPEHEAWSCEQLTQLAGSLAQHEPFWVSRLAKTNPLTLREFLVSQGNLRTPSSFDQALPEEAIGLIDGANSSVNRDEWICAAFAAFLGRWCGEAEFDLGCRVQQSPGDPSRADSLFASVVPLRVELAMQEPFAKNLTALQEELREVQRRKRFARDIATRYPELREPSEHMAAGLHYPVQVEFVGDLDEESACDEELGDSLRLVIPRDAKHLRWCYDAATLPEERVRFIAEHFATWLRGLAAAEDTAINAIPLLDNAEYHTIIDSWNDTALEFPADQTIHGAFELQARTTPDAVAVVCGSGEITYRELDERANQLAGHLRGLGVGADTRVGIALERSIDLVVGLLGVLKAGGAYVPLDLSYPAERIRFIVEDAGAPVIVTQERAAGAVPPTAASVVLIDADWPEIETADLALRPENPAGPGTLAYVIHTSGSTGKPKGVMVEHRNVLNFFAAMDDRIEVGKERVWLATTSISFDISVLELFWTLCRGFKVVLYRPGDVAA